MGAPKIDKYPIQILSLTQIKVDHSIQSRVETSIEFQREFSEAMLRGDTFPNITVFFDGRYYWLADGFHRLGAAKQASRMDPKLSGIKAEVRNGTRRDAVVFSAGANQKFSIPRTQEDIKKAVAMLILDEEWQSMSPGIIAKHVGIKKEKAKRLMDEAFKDLGIAFPEKTVCETRHGGRMNIPFRRHGAEIREKINAGISTDSTIRDCGRLAGLLGFRNIICETVRDAAFGCEVAVAGSTASVAFETKGENNERLVLAIGKLLIFRATNPDVRRLVVCGNSPIKPNQIQAGRLIGIEFLTPDELVASLTPTP